MSRTLVLSDAPPSRRGRWQLLLLLGVVIGPMLLATAMYQWNFWVPQGRNYHGELIGTGQTRDDLGVTGATSDTWQLLVTAPQQCDSECQHLVYLARQIQIGLNRDATRASHALANAQPLATDYEAMLKREYPQLGRYQLDPAVYREVNGDQALRLWIVDPHGNLVLRYDSKAGGRAILKDLQLLLKLSQIG